MTNLGEILGGNFSVDTAEKINTEHLVAQPYPASTSFAFFSNARSSRFL